MAGPYSSESRSSFGGSSTGALHRLRSDVATRPVRGRFCGFLAEWRIRGDLAARIAFTALPPGMRIVVDEVGPGAVELAADGLRPGWHLRLRAGGAQVAGAGDGRCPGEPAASRRGPAAGGSGPKNTGRNE